MSPIKERSKRNSIDQSKTVILPKIKGKMLLRHLYNNQLYVTTSSNKRLKRKPSGHHHHPIDPVQYEYLLNRMLKKQL